MRSGKTMKTFRQYLSSIPIIHLCLLLIVFALASCGGVQTKKTADKTVEVVTQKATRDYLPVRQYDEAGQLLPFEPKPNPYLEIKGKIDKQAVVSFIEARKAYKSKNYERAEALLRQIIETDKKLAGPWVMLGNIAEENKQSDQAIDHYLKAIQVNRLNVNAYLPLARLQREKGQFLEAQNTYAEALAVWRDFPEAHLNLAILYDLYLNDSLQAQQHMEAFQFLKGEKDAQVAEWLKEIRSRTGIEPNLYIGPSNASQIQSPEGDKTGT